MCYEGITVIIAGVGGQGTLLASTLIGDAAVKSDFKVRISETFGMSQRGGSVVTHIRMGKEIYSPITPLNTADLIIGFEPLETYRNALKFLKPGGNVVFNNRPIYSKGGKEEYLPVAEMVARIRLLAGQVVAIDAMDLAIKAGPDHDEYGDVGAAAVMLPFKSEILRSTITERVKKDINANLLAFDSGVRAIKSLEKGA